MAQLHKTVLKKWNSWTGGESQDKHTDPVLPRCQSVTYLSSCEPHCGAIVYLDEHLNILLDRGFDKSKGHQFNGKQLLMSRYFSDMAVCNKRIVRASRKARRSLKVRTDVRQNNKNEYRIPAKLSDISVICSKNTKTEFWVDSHHEASVTTIREVLNAGLEPNTCGTPNRTDPKRRKPRRLHFQEIMLPVSKSLPMLRPTEKDVGRSQLTGDKTIRLTSKPRQAKDMTLQRTLMVQTLFGSKHQNSWDSYEDEIDSFMRSRTESV